MQIQETALKGVLILTFDGQTDARGTMNVTIDTSAMADAGISFACKEQRLYHMPKKGTFFGIHFQTKRHPQDKLIHLLAGRGMDYVIDLRRVSPHTENGLPLSCGAEIINASSSRRDPGMPFCHWRTKRHSCSRPVNLSIGTPPCRFALTTHRFISSSPRRSQPCPIMTETRLTPETWNSKCERNSCRRKVAHPPPFCTLISHAGKAKRTVALKALL